MMSNVGRWLLLMWLLFCIRPTLWTVALATPVELPTNVLNLPSIPEFKPEANPNVPIKLREWRCDNPYNGVILPCLMRPYLPPYSYVSAFGYNTEYKKKRDSE